MFYFQQPLLQSPVSHCPSEIIIILCSGNFSYCYQCFNCCQCFFCNIKNVFAVLAEKKKKVFILKVFTGTSIVGKNIYYGSQ